MTVIIDFCLVLHPFRPLIVAGGQLYFYEVKAIVFDIYWENISLFMPRPSEKDDNTIIFGHLIAYKAATSSRLA